MLSSSLVAFSLACSNSPNPEACAKALEASYYQWHINLYADEVGQKMKKQIENYFPGGMRGATFAAIAVEGLAHNRLNYPIVLNGEKDIKLVTTASWNDPKQYSMTLIIGW